MALSYRTVWTLKFTMSSLRVHVWCVLRSVHIEDASNCALCKVYMFSRSLVCIYVQNHSRFLSTPAGYFKEAEQDLVLALSLDPENAEITIGLRETRRLLDGGAHVEGAS